MTQILFKGNSISTAGQFPKKGDQAPSFTLVTKDLSEITLKDYLGKKLILNIFPSVDTSVCASSVRQFNEKVSNVKDTVILCISKDLPFAQSRFCGAEGIKNVIMLSDMNRNTFGKDYGIEMVNGPLANLLARAVIVLNEKCEVQYTELVEEITKEPNYEKAFAAVAE